MSPQCSILLSQQTPKLCWNVCCKAFFEPGRSRHCGSAEKGHALWKPDTWMLLLPVPPFCKLPPPPAQTPPVPLGPLPSSYETTLSKAEPGSRCHKRSFRPSLFCRRSGGKPPVELVLPKTFSYHGTLWGTSSKFFLPGWLSTLTAPHALQTIIK